MMIILYIISSVIASYILFKTINDDTNEKIPTETVKGRLKFTCIVLIAIYCIPLWIAFILLVACFYIVYHLINVALFPFHFVVWLIRGKSYYKDLNKLLYDL